MQTRVCVLAFIKRAAVRQSRSKTERDPMWLTECPALSFAAKRTICLCSSCAR